MTDLERGYDYSEKVKKRKEKEEEEKETYWVYVAKFCSWAKQHGCALQKESRSCPHVRHSLYQKGLATGQN